MTKTWYSFDGWYTQAVGGEEALGGYTGLRVESDMTLFAHWTREPGVGADLEDAVGDAGVVEKVTDGWKVTFTNDVVGMVEFGDNLGPVTLDLKGRNLVGAAGTTGDAVGAPGGDGEPAIRIAATGEDGNPTVLTIVDSIPDDTDDVIGGRGGDGTPGGNGGAGVQVGGDAKEGVRINVGASVCIRGGAGGRDLSGRLYDGKDGAGVEGVVGTNEGTIVDADEADVIVRVADSGKAVGEPDPASLPTNYTVSVRASGLSVSGFGGYCRRAPGEAEGTYAINFVCTRLPQGFGGRLVVEPGVFTVVSAAPVEASGVVAGPKVDAGGFVKSGSASWKAKADVGSAFVRWEASSNAGEIARALLAVLPAATLAKETLTLKVPAGTKVRPDEVRAVWRRIDKDVPAGQVALLALCDASRGTTKGTGLYAVGKAVSVSATAAGGYVFAGWYEDAGFSRPAVFGGGSSAKDYRTASQSVKLGAENVYLYARFVEKTTVADPISWLRYAGAGYCGADAGFLAETETWYQGVALPGGACRILFGSASLPTVKVSGLPPGVKFDKAACALTGVPTKAGSFAVEISVKNASGSTAVLRREVVVRELPPWAAGNFDGWFRQSFATSEGSLSVTVSSSGTVSGKASGGGVSATLSSASLSGVEQTGGGLAYRIDAVVAYKVGGVTLSRTDVLRLAEDPATGLGVVSASADGVVGCRAVQRAWERKDMTLPAFATGKDAPTLLTDEGVSLLFGAKGSVKFSGVVSGVAVSGTAQFLPSGFSADGTTLRGTVFAYSTPKNAPSFARWYEVELALGKDARGKDVFKSVKEIGK